MSKTTKYLSRQPDSKGYIQWTEEENERWNRLYNKQSALLDGRACQQYLDGLKMLQLSSEEIPQLYNVDEVLQQTTGWKTAPVPALINFTEFFTLLANKQFPVATFIRSEDEFDYLKEPDIFHEIFGHCPLLTNHAFAHFTQTYGKLGLAANKEDRAYLARLYWFTVEFGLVNSSEGLRIYGGGILSSPGETLYALESDEPERKPLEPLDVLRTPYRIDIMQPIYYVLADFEHLYELAEMNVMSLVEKAKSLGLYEPKFPFNFKNAS
ncbi:phenylalanine 4-monooxygenase [Glaciecola sp. 1036]|uniref:phenylalanine 4-monooxygenase n=1 Tax=Alteromonadaceae TaxID=72275 RepID=UPI003D068BC1